MANKKLVDFPEKLWLWLNEESERMERSVSWVIRHYLEKAMQRDPASVKAYTGGGVLRDKTLAILDYCDEPRSVKEIEAHLSSLGYDTYDMYTRMSNLTNAQGLTRRVGSGIYQTV
jgi:hypothetical protein